MIKLSELQPDTVAIKSTAIYVGIPSQGHKTCCIDYAREWQPLRLEEVTRNEPAIETKRCCHCGELLVKE